MHRVSIIVPIYNVAPYICECLESISSQTFTDMEVILVDDCGTDESMQIAEDFVRSYSGPIDFRIVHHDKNRGLSAARNTGILNANGEYLYFLDSDDWIVPECLELMVSCIEKYPESEIVFAGAERIPSHPSMSVQMDYTGKTLPEYSDNHVWIKTMMLRRTVFFMTSWNKLVKTDFVKDNSLLFPEGYIHEDEVWNFRLSNKVSKIAVCKHNTYVYRGRDDSIMGKENYLRNTERFIDTLELMASEINSELINEQVVSLWDCSTPRYNNKETPVVSKVRLRRVLLKAAKHAKFSLRCLIAIYLYFPGLYQKCFSVPKLNGLINLITGKYKAISC